MIFNLSSLNNFYPGSPFGKLFRSGALRHLMSMIDLHARKLFNRLIKTSLLAGITLGACLLHDIGCQGEEPISMGPLAHSFSLTLDPGTTREEALGPLLSYESSEFSSQWALHPLLSYRKTYSPEIREFDLLYPLFTYDRFGGEYRFQLFQLLSYSGGKHQPDTPVDRVTVFPFYFQQRSPDPDKNYTALVPFYGTIKNRLMRDEIHFVLFPLYAKTRKADVTTYNYLYPVFHWREGNGLKGWQVWPLAGYQTKEITHITNRFDEVEMVPGHRKMFALWPFFNDQHTRLGTDNPEHAQAFLPFYYVRRSPKRDSTTLLFPFINFLDDREHKYKEWGAPWPFVVFGDGPNKQIDRVWPLYGQTHQGTTTSKFLLWPLYRYSHLSAQNIERERTRILLFLFSDVTEKAKPSGGESRRIDLWPLFTTRKDREGNERLQLLAPLEPILPNHKSIERNYSPVWSVWRSEKNAKTGEASQSFFWNLYRSERSPTLRKYSLLFGLIQYESRSDRARWRLFYIPLGRKGSD